MSRYTVAPATLEMADQIASRMRLSDVNEIKAISGSNPWEAARRAVIISEYAFCGLVEGDPFYLFGFSGGTAIGDRKWIWGLGTEGLERHQRTFWPASKNFIAFARGHAGELMNYVDCRNRLSIRWLKRLGFTFEEPAPYGVEGRDCMRFSIRGGFLHV